MIPADQFVAKHFPTPWFNSLTGQSAGTQNGVTYTSQPALNQPSTPEYDGPGAPTSGAADNNCDANHDSNLDDPTYGLAHDLSLPANEVPSFNWITPNNCSDAHDASCQGNNLSGAFNASGSPDYTPAGLPADDPEATTPNNYTGGLYAADLFLRYYVPMIEQSAAFADGGLIDITFDESNPPFTTGNSFNNVPAPGDKTTSSPPADQPTFGSAGTTEPGATSLYGAYGALSDAAGENIDGHNVNTEPTGPNDPEVTNSSGQQLQPGPGAAAFIDRPLGLAGESPNVSGSPGTASEPADRRGGLQHGDRRQDQCPGHGPADLGHRRRPATRSRPTPSSEPSATPARMRCNPTPARRRLRTTTPSRGSARSNCSTTADSRSRCLTASTAASR